MDQPTGTIINEGLINEQVAQDMILYDAEGNPISVTTILAGTPNQKGCLNVMLYDQLGNIIGASNPLVMSVIQQYTLISNVNPLAADKVTTADTNVHTITQAGICAVRRSGLFWPSVLRRCLTACFAAVRYRCASTCSSVTIFFCEVCSVVLFQMRPCLYPSLRGRPRTVKYVRARANPPDTDKIYSIVLRDSQPLHNRVTPGRMGQVNGKSRAGMEPQGIRSPPGRRINTVTWSICFSVLCSCVLHLMAWAEDRATVGTDPSAAAGLEEE